MNSISSPQRIVLSLSIIIIASLTLALAKPWRASGQGGNQVTTVSAASYTGGLAPESIAAAFGVRLATRIELATAQPLPKSLAGTTVRVDGELAPLFFVSPGQVNYLIPPGTPAGIADVMVTSGDGAVSRGIVDITTAAPALFAANANGLGPLASQLLRVKANGQFIFEQLSRYSESEQRFVTKAFDFGEPGDQLFLVLYLTGIRQALPSSVRVNIGGVEYAPSGIAPVQGFTGLDQINVPLPRNFGGRGNLKLFVKAPGFGASNEGEFEIGSGARDATLQIARVPSSPVLVGEEVEIGGSGFAANPFENAVLIVADDGVTTKAEVLSVAGDRLQMRVPFGAGAGQLRVSRGQSEASAQIQVRTSVSGFVQEFKEGRRVAVVGLPLALREPSGRRIETVTDSNGSFVLKDAVASPLSLIELSGQAADGIRYPAQARKMTVRANRDNQYKGDGDLANIVEIKRISAATTSLAAANTPVNETVRANEPADTIISGGVTFETNNSTITFPGSGSGQLGLTVLDPGRTPSNLPTGHFSSTIAQITPFGARLNPGGRLIFPNTGSLPAGTKARLFKFDQTTGQATLGQFIDVGEAGVSADGQRVETAANAITETSYYFVSIPRPLAAINGRVLESDGRPAPRAVVQARGQSAFTDGFGGFVLRNAPVLKAGGDRVKVEVNYQRPDGSISRKESDEVEILANQLATVKPEIVLDPVTKNFPPVILAPSSLTITTGETRDFDFIALDPDSAQPPQVSVSGNATAFTVLSNQGNGAYRLRLTPASNAAGSYTLSLIAADNANQRSTQNIAITANQPDNSKPTANSQSVTMAEDTARQITLAGRDPGGRTLSYVIVTPPSQGNLTGSSPNLTYTPARDFNGVDSLTFKASNGSTESLPATVLIAVSPVNDAPVLSVPGPQVLNAGESLNLLVTATDVDGEQNLKLTAANLPPGATFVETGGTSRLLSWTPDFTQARSYTITITAADNGSPALTDAKTIAIAVRGQWERTSLPNHKVQALLVVQPDSLFAGTAAGIFRSDNDGQSWTASDTGLTVKNVRALAEVETQLLAGTDGGGVFRSNNRGASWSAANNGLTNLKILAIAADSSGVFAGTDGGGVFRSNDRGDSWQAVNTGLTTARILALALDGASAFAGTESGAFRSTNRGASWSVLNSGFPASTIVNAFAKKGAVLLAATNHGIFQLDGQSWRRIYAIRRHNLALSQPTLLAGQNITINGEGFAADPQDNLVRISSPTSDFYPQVISASPTQLTIKVPLGVAGNTLTVNSPQDIWVPATVQIRTSVSGFVGDFQGKPREGITVRLPATGASVLTGADGLFVLPDPPVGERVDLEAVVFIGLFPAFTARRVVRIEAGRDNNTVSLFIEFVIRPTNAAASPTVTRSVNDEDAVAAQESTEAAQPTDPSVNFTSLAVLGDAIIAGTDGNGVYLSNNDGQTWVGLNGSLNNSTVSALAVNGTKLFSGAPVGVSRLINKGQSWVPTNTGLTDLNLNSILANRGNLFVAALAGGVFRSSDQGRTWAPVNEGLLVEDGEVRYKNVQTVVANGADLLAATFGDGVYRSTDQGAKWGPANTGLTNKFVNELFVSGSTVYAGTDGGVFRSLDGGVRWMAINAGLTTLRVVSFTSNAGVVYAGTEGGGVFKLNSDGLSWTRISNGLTSLAVTALGAGNGVLYAGTSGGGICISRNGGETWVPVNNQIPSNLNVFTFAVSGKKVYAGSIFGVFVTEDEGQSWKQINAGLLSVFVTQLTVVGDRLYAGTANGGVFVSTIP